MTDRLSELRLNDTVELCQDADPACPACKGECDNHANTHLTRVDMDRSSLLFCAPCAVDAVKSGVFAYGADPETPEGDPEPEGAKAIIDEIELEYFAVIDPATDTPRLFDELSDAEAFVSESADAGLSAQRPTEIFLVTFVPDTIEKAG